MKNIKAKELARRWNRQVRYVTKYGKRYNTAEELLDDILPPKKNQKT